MSRSAAAALVLVIAPCLLAWAGDLNPEEIVAKHLAAIGSPEARKGIKSRVVQGGAIYRVLLGGTGVVPGKFQFASEGQKSDVLFKLDPHASGSYLGEWFICDGNKLSVTATNSNKTRSALGNFVLQEDAILRHNLLGGVWSSAWPLLDLEARKTKLHFDGIKKIGDKELLLLRYLPKGTDLDIFLYFDPQTFRHIMTVYRMEPSASIVGGETAQAGKQQPRYELDEYFSDFRTVDGLTLPNHYDLRFTRQGEIGFSTSVEWEVRVTGITNNMSIDPRSFQVQ